MNNKFSLSTFIALMVVMLGVAQQDNSVKISVFKPEEKTSKPVPPPQELQNYIKWNYSLIGRGVFLLNYEKPVAKLFSTEVGVGVTYRDFIFESFYDRYTPKFVSQSAGLGFALEGGARFFPAGFDNFEGFFLSPVISFRRYNVPVDEKLIQGNSATTLKQGYDFTDLQFKIGYAYESWWFDDIVSEFYAGVAMRYATSRYYTEGSYTPNGQQTLIPNTVNFKYPQFLMGMKIGVPF
jgi:hypothetical protein